MGPCTLKRVFLGCRETTFLAGHKGLTNVGSSQYTTHLAFEDHGTVSANPGLQEVPSGDTQPTPPRLCPGTSPSLQGPPSPIPHLLHSSSSILEPGPPQRDSGDI